MSIDCGIELRNENVACLGLLVNGVKTEFAKEQVSQKGDKLVLKLDPTNPFINVII
jgi:hypothetical protein